MKKKQNLKARPKQVEKTGLQDGKRRTKMKPLNKVKYKKNFYDEDIS